LEAVSDQLSAASRAISGRWLRGSIITSCEYDTYAVEELEADG
jgi:hypothetical protein